MQNPGRLIGSFELQGRFRGVRRKNNKFMSNEQLSQWELLERMFSSERLRQYLESTAGNKEKAEALYVWNNRVSAAMWEQLAFLEVAIRNTISLQLERRYQKLGCSQHWVFDPSGELASSNTKARDQLRQAKNQVLSNGQSLEPSQIISELPFGFWHLLLSKKFRFLWPDIAEGFKGLNTRNPTHVSQLLKDLRWFRNRIGHHHSLLKIDLEAKDAQIREMSYYVDPDFGKWLEQTSQVKKNLLVYPNNSGIVAP